MMCPLPDKLPYPGKIPSENQEQRALVKWCYTQPLLRDLIIHIPNEGKRSIMLGWHMKLMGVRRGVSDLFLPLPTKTYHGLWLEIKRIKGAKPTPEQLDWLAKMNALGYCARVCYGWVEGRKVILEYLSHNTPQAT